MPTRPLPNDPSLEHLRKQAKRLRRALRDGDPHALALLTEFHPRTVTSHSSCSLADAQLITARSYGYASWTQLKQHLAAMESHRRQPSPAVDGTTVADAFIRLACLTYTFDWNQSNPARAKRLLVEHPEIVTTNIYAAAASGDVAAIEQTIGENGDLVAAAGGPFRWPPLLYACYSRLQADAGRSTLLAARWLLSRGADPNSGFLLSGRYAFTALTGAFGRGEDWDNQLPHPECDALARLLLEAGADPNDSQTLYNRHFQPEDDHLRILLAHGLGNDGRGPWLTRINDPRVTPSRLLTEEVWSAAAKNFPARLKLLVEHGVDIHTPGLRDGTTPVYAATRAGNSTIVDYLVQHGAKRVALDPREELSVALIAGRHDEVRSRLAADPALFAELGTHRHIELLNRAVEADNREGIQLLLSLGVDINGMIPGTGFDRAALHNAAGAGRLDMVIFLIALGANPHLEDLAFQSTPIGWAYHGGHRDVVRHLLQYADLFDALRCDGVERVQSLLREEPALVNARDAEGCALVTYLHPEMEHLREMLDVLTAYAADLNVLMRGRTFLDRVIERGLREFGDTLRGYGAKTAAEI